MLDAKEICSITERLNGLSRHEHADVSVALEAAEIISDVFEEINLVKSECVRLRAALERIARWHGEFPDTGRFWDEPENKRPMSFGACNGSNGEREYMRCIAQEALKPSR